MSERRLKTEVKYIDCALTSDQAIPWRLVLGQPSQQRRRGDLEALVLLQPPLQPQLLGALELLLRRLQLQPLEQDSQPQQPLQLQPLEGDSLQQLLQPPLQLQLLVALEPQRQLRLLQPLAALGLQPPPRQPLHLEGLGLQLQHLLQPLEDLERRLPVQLVLALALGLLQQLRHLEVLGLPQPLRLQPQLLEALDQRQEQSRLHLEALELLAQLALVQAGRLVLELEVQQVLEHLPRLVSERRQEEDLEVRQELLLLRAILQTH